MTIFATDKEWKMNRKWIWFLGPLALAAFITLGGEVVMHLWNWLTPQLFGGKQIGFWQALGLLALCRILFGGLGCHSGNGGHKDGCRQRGPGGERESFRARMHARWHGPAAGSERPAAGSQTGETA
jgi:hypothetical protein